MSPALLLELAYLCHVEAENEAREDDHRHLEKISLELMARAERAAARPRKEPRRWRSA